MVRKLLVFNRTTKHIDGRMDFWDENWMPIVDYWRTYDFATEKAIAIQKTVPEIDENGLVIQPANWDSESSNAYDYVDPKEISNAFVNGTIKNEQEEGIYDVTIQLLKDTQIKYSAQSNSEGVYEILRIYPDNYVLKVTKSGYVTHQEELTINLDEQIGKDITLIAS